MRCHGITVIGRRCKLKCGSDFCHIHNDQTKKVKKQKEQCSICLDPLKSPLKLSCDHSFCRECIQTWICNTPNCPYCRKIVNDSERDMSYDHGLRNKILIQATKIKILISDCTTEELDMLRQEIDIYKGSFINEELLQIKECFSIIKKLPQIKILVYFKCSTLEFYNYTLKNNIYYFFE